MMDLGFVFVVCLGGLFTLRSETFLFWMGL